MSKDDDAGTPGSNRDTHYAKLRRAHRDAKREKQGLPPAQPKGKRDLPARKGALYMDRAAADTIHLYGLHTVRAAIDNPARRITGLKATRNALMRLEIAEDANLPFPLRTRQHPRRSTGLLGDDAVHQGVLLEASAADGRGRCPPSAMRRCWSSSTRSPTRTMSARSCAPPWPLAPARLITTQRHSPQESGVLAKVRFGRARDSSTTSRSATSPRAIEDIRAQGFTTVGLDSEGPAPIEAGLSGNRIALVLGAEGKGLRQKTRETVDILTRLDMPGTIKSLNVSNAAAIALYAADRHLGRN
jgi:23S rRNA (guanosine2251-2'-O)-methyltransferase